MVEGQWLGLKDSSELSGSRLIAQSKFLREYSGQKESLFFITLLDRYGVVAQLVEHLLCKQGVVGSSPSGSTNLGFWFGEKRPLDHGLIAQLVRARA